MTKKIANPSMYAYKDLDALIQTVRSYAFDQDAEPEVDRPVQGWVNYHDWMDSSFEDGLKVHKDEDLMGAIYRVDEVKPDAAWVAANLRHKVREFKSAGETLDKDTRDALRLELRDVAPLKRSRKLVPAIWQHDSFVMNSDVPAELEHLVRRMHWIEGGTPGNHLEPDRWHQVASDEGYRATPSPLGMRALLAWLTSDAQEDGAPDRWVEKVWCISKKGARRIMLEAPKPEELAEVLRWANIQRGQFSVWLDDVRVGFQIGLADGFPELRAVRGPAYPEDFIRLTDWLAVQLDSAPEVADDEDEGDDGGESLTEDLMSVGTLRRAAALARGDEEDEDEDEDLIEEGTDDDA